MIHTIQYGTIPFWDDVELIKATFTLTKQNNQLVYFKKYRALDLIYYSFYNSLHIKINLNTLINKPIISDIDYYSIIEEYQKQFYSLGFQYTNPMYKLNRVDYKQDIFTPYKALYLKLLKKGSDNYRYLKQFDKYKTSIYYSSDSENINIYDKYEQLFNIGKKDLINIDEYADLLRFEIQFKRNKLYYLLNHDGLYRELINYFSIKDHDYYINQTLRKIIYSGDYYNLYGSEKILLEHNTRSMTDKLLELQKDISTNGISEAKKHYKSATYNNYIKLFNAAEVNPIPIPKNDEIPKLKNLFNFTDNNIYLLNNYKLIA